FSDDSASFELAWHPGAMMDSAATDSATIRVIFYASYLTPCVSAPQLAYDTVLLHVKLHGLSVPAEYALSANTIKTDTLLTCMSLDTTLDIINQGCDSIAITKALLAKNAWSVTDLAGNKLKLPIHLGSGDTLRLELHATPTSTAVLYDSLKVTMHYMGNDTLWGAALRTYVKLNAAQPALATQATLAFDSLAICDSTDELVTLTNTGCDTLSINKFDLTDTHFELLDTNGKPLALPLKLDTNSSRQVKVRFIPGTLGNKTATLRLHYLRSLYSAFDSSNVIQLSGTGAASGTVTFADTVDFGNVSTCGSAEDTLFFRNTSCDSAFIESISIPPPFILLDSAKLSSAIGSGEVLMLRVLYQPGAKVHDSGDAVVRVLINNGQTTLTGTIHFSGNGTAGSSTFETNPPLTATTFAFGTLSECDHADSVTFTVYNTGCDTLHVTGLTLDPSLQGTFAGFADKPLPALLGKGDSL
ncbi:MAG TPA: choice-of-anchor D domain-containing protein, partial [Candidatus Kapabacteria bacterium]|nr:choice-of-anchor D domain-containing protein [Candidatus Kapabacteria bacterium]